MSHFYDRLNEIETNKAAIRERVQRAAERERLDALYEQVKSVVDCGVPVGHDPDGDPDHFLPTRWAPSAVWEARKRAKKRGLPFKQLDVGFVLRMLERQEYKCALSGIEFSAKRPRDSHKRPWMPSLDRIDCARGYTPDNVRIVCVAVNTLLQDWGDSVFHTIIEASKR